MKFKLIRTIKFTNHKSNREDQEYRKVTNDNMWTETQMNEAERRAFRVSLQSLPKQDREAKWKAFNSIMQARKVEMQEQRKAERAAFCESLKGLSAKEKKAKWAERRAQNAVKTANRRAKEMEQARAAAASAREVLSPEDVQAACEAQAENRAFNASLKGLSKEEKQAKRQARKLEMKAKRQVKCAEFRASLKGLSQEEKKVKRADRQARVRAMRAIRIANRRAEMQAERNTVSVSNLSLDEDKAAATSKAIPTATKTRTAKNGGVDAIVKADMTAFKKSIADLDDEQKQERIQARVSNIKKNMAKLEQEKKPRKLRIARMKLNRTLRLAEFSSEERETVCKAAAVAMPVGNKGGGIRIVLANMAAFKRSVADLDEKQKHARIKIRISNLKANIGKFEEEKKPGKIRIARMKLNQTLRFAFFETLANNGGGKLKPFEKKEAWKAHRAQLEMQQQNEPGQLTDDETVLVEETEEVLEQIVDEKEKEDAPKKAIADMVVLDGVGAYSDTPDIEKMDFVETAN